MNTENTVSDIFDGRTIPCSEKHGMIIEKWRNLSVGKQFILINDHDPVRLHKQFTELWPGTFAWQYLVQGPEEFRIQITKLQALPEVTAPCPLTCNH
jgi:uncharacterized protein (DUF2249 family)